MPPHRRSHAAVRTAALALAALSCTADHGAGPARPFALQADFTTTALPAVRINEIHYDNTSTDVGEAIEIEGPGGADLTGWRVVLYNGAAASLRVYDEDTLNETIITRCSGRGVVVIDYPSNGIQNGSPDGIALVDVNGGVVEFLSYEGTFTAADGPAAGTVSIDIRVAEGSSTPIGLSLQRNSAGVWQAPAPATFGRCNEGDEPPPPPGPTITFTGRLTTDPPLPVGFEDQLFATLLDPSGDTVATTFTWSSETPAMASIDQRGVMRALDAGTAIIRATAEDGTTATVSLPTRVAVASTTALYQGNAEFGEPADADASDDFIVRRAQYTASYNRNRGTPNWVSYDLEATHFGAEDRCDCFTFDPLLPAAFPHYTTADYTGAGAFHGYGIDRGHLARSFDRTSGSLDNATTFYFTNIIPHAADLNQGPWAVMENHLGDLARFEDKEVYVVAGPAGSKGTVKDEGKITIPASAWKVAVILPRDQGRADLSPQDLDVIAVIMPNDPGVRNVDWHTYTTTVDAVEATSGYDLLADLPDWIESIVEANDRFPTASAGGPYAGVEGSAVAFSAAGSTDPDGDALSYAWDFGDGATGTREHPTHVYADNGAYTATVISTDPHGAADTASAAVTVENASPTITGLVVPAAPVLAGQPVTIGLAFTDPGSADTHTISVAWGDGTTNGSLSHAYQTPGLYRVTVTVRDDDGGAATRAAATYVVVYDPAAGFVTGGGWVNGVRGRAIFGFEFRYRDGAATPAGALEFRAGDGLIFTGERSDWLVVAPGYAKLRGTGALRGKGRTGSCAYLLTVVEGATDGFRLKIWDAAGTVVYDDRAGEPDDSRAVTPLGGGSINVQER